MSLPLSTFRHVMENEGGFVLTEYPDDRGGETYAGISRVHNPDWPGWAIIDGGTLKSPELEDLVLGIYLERYWEPLRLDDMADWRLAEMVFSFGVVAGPGTAAKTLQALAGVTADGVIGSHTLSAVADWRDGKPSLELARADLRARFALAQVRHFAAVVAQHPKQITHLRGWMNRVIGDYDAIGAP